VRVNQGLYGSGAIEVPSKSIPWLLVHEVLNPFYIFQFFSFIVWYNDEYALFATIILAISLSSIVSSLVSTKMNIRRIQEMAHFVCPINALRDGEFKIVESSELVPGDVFIVPDNQYLPCDAILANGHCIVNESMLTGESMPVVKGNFKDQGMPFSLKTHQKSFLYGGTEVMQTRPHHERPALAVVCRTNYQTAKGQLVRDILFPTKNSFKLYSDSLKFVLFMGCLAVSAFVISIPKSMQYGYSNSKVLIRSLELITIAVPPQLPVSMTISALYSLNRLKNNFIYCISPPSINVAGRVQIMVFDKTGTLTEDGLEVLGYIPKNERN